MLGDITTQGGVDLSELRGRVKTYINALYTNTLIAFGIPASIIDDRLPNLQEHICDIIMDDIQSKRLNNPYIR